MHMVLQFHESTSNYYQNPFKREDILEGKQQYLTRDLKKTDA